MAKLLIVEDNTHLQELYQQELRVEGHDVDIVSTGSEALTYLQSQRPDLIVLDIVLPGMNGLEVLDKVVAGNRSIPVILHSAYTGYKDHCMTWSADAYVLKSGDLKELKSTIADLLARRRSNDQRQGERRVTA